MSHPRCSLAIAIALLLDASPSRAQWTVDGVLVSSASGTNVSPVVVPDGTGGSLIGWQYSGPSPKQVLLSHLTSDGQLAPGFPAAGIPVAADGSSPSFRSARSDGDQGIVLGWLVGADCAVTRLHGDGALATGWSPGGNTFTFPNGANSAAFLDFCPDGAGGGWILVRYDYSFCPDICYNSSSASAKHISASGVGDGSVGIASSPYYGGTGGSLFPAAGGVSFAYGYGGDGFDAWIDRVDGSGSLWHLHLDVQHIAALNAVDDGAGGGLLLTLGGYGLMPPRLLHVLATGAFDPTWPLNGVPVISETASPSYVPAVAGDAGSILFAWTTSGPNGVQVRMQKITAAGLVAAGWPDTGRVVCDAPGARDDLSLASDGAGGAFAAWRDGRDVANGDVYAHHVWHDGRLDPAFATHGTGVVTLHAGVGTLHLAPVATGAAVLAWSDLRSAGDSQIRAALVQIAGPLAVDPRPKSRLALAGFTPNPSPSGQPRIAFNLAEPGDVTLELFDVLGRRVHQQQVDGAAAGWHSLAVSSALPAGLYEIRLRTGADVRSARGLILR